MIKLNFIKNKILNLKDLLTGEEKQIRVDEDGNTVFNIQKPAYFKFYRYEIKKD